MVFGVLGVLIPGGTLGPVHPSLVTALLGIPAGAWASTWHGRLNGYQQGMMMIYANERESPIISEKVTGQAECMAPKSLLQWRAKDWRYQDGEPYLWCQLPHGVEIFGSLAETLDYLTLDNDPYRARTSSLQVRRNINRMMSQSAESFQSSDRKNEEVPHPLLPLVPYLVYGGVLVGGVALVIFTSG